MTDRGGHQGTGDDPAPDSTGGNRATLPLPITPSPRIGHAGRRRDRDARRGSSSSPGGAGGRGAEVVTGFLRRIFHADGADRSGLSQLSYVTVANFACDAVLAVALANTLFFSAATAESREKVALYLLVTVAPFALIAPVIGPALDRLRSGRRLTLSVTFSARAVLAVVLALQFDSWLLYPLALAMMVLSKTFGVVKASITPHVLPPALDLVRTNSRLTILGHVGGSLVAGGVAGAVSWLWDSPTALWLLAGIALVAAYLSMTIPPRAEATDGEESATISFASGPPDGENRRPRGAERGRASASGLKSVLTRPLGRDVLAALWAESSARMLTGFLTLFLAFVAKADSEATAVGQATMLALAGAAGGVGTFVGNGIGARLPLGKPLRIALTAASAGLAVAVVAAVLPTSWTAITLALVAAVASALGKVALDSSIQTDIPDSARSSAFGRSETALQLSWVAGGALGVLLPPHYTVGFAVISIACALFVAQAVLTARGTSLVPRMGGNRPRTPDTVGDPHGASTAPTGRMRW